MRPYKTITIHTTSPDPINAFVGSSPYGGETNGTGIVLPPDITTAQSNRYLCRLLGFTLPGRAFAVITELRQMLTIGTDVLVEENGPAFPIELPVTDPNWRFVNGNVSWHLRKVGPSKGPDTRVVPIDGVSGVPYTFSRVGTSPAILARRIPVSAGGGGYIPLNRGIPYGKDIAGLGSFTDLRYPWSDEANQNVDIEVVGPGDFTFYASVHQTDPDTRPDPPVVAEGAWTRPEDSFLFHWPEARYWRVGARMTVQVYHQEAKG